MRRLLEVCKSDPARTNWVSTKNFLLQSVRKLNTPKKNSLNAWNFIDELLQTWVSGKYLVSSVGIEKYILVTHTVFFLGTHFWVLIVPCPTLKFRIELEIKIQNGN